MVGREALWQRGVPTVTAEMQTWRYHRIPPDVVGGLAFLYIYICAPLVHSFWLPRVMFQVENRTLNGPNIANIPTEIFLTTGSPLTLLTYTKITQVLSPPSEVLTGLSTHA